MGKITALEEQLRNPDTTVRVRADARDSVAGAAALGLDRLQQLTGRVADITAGNELDQQRQVRSQKLTDAKLTALGQLTELQLKYEKDNDPDTMWERWQNDAQQIRETVGTGFGDDPGLKKAFDDQFQEWELREKLSISKTAGAKIAARGRAKLDAGLDQFSALLARTDDPAATQQVKEAAIASIASAVESGYLDPETAGDMERGFLRKADQAKVMTVIERDPQAALKLLQDPDRFTGLDETDRPAYLNQAQSEIRRQEAEARQRETEARISRQAEISLSFDDALVTAAYNGKQDVLSEAEILAAYPGKTGQKMVDRLRSATTRGIDRLTVAGQSLAADQELLASARPKEGGTVTAEAADRYQSLLKLVEDKRRAVETDPAGYVMGTNQAVKDAWAAVNAAPQNDAQASNQADLQQAAMRNAIEITRQAQLDLGVTADKVRVMPVAQAEAMAAQLSAAKPSERPGAVQSAYGAFGLDGIKEIEAAGAPKSTRALVTIDNPQWSAELAEAETRGNEELAKAVKARGVTPADIDDAVAALWTDVGDTLPGSAQDAYLDAVTKVARVKAAAGMSATDAAAAAMRPITEGWTFQDGYRVPGQVDADRVADGLDALIVGADKLDIAPPGSMDPNLDEAYRTRETLRAIRGGQHRWLTNAAGDGVILAYPDGTPVMTKKGDRLEFKYEDLAAGVHGTMWTEYGTRKPGAEGY